MPAQLNRRSIGVPITRAQAGFYGCASERTTSDKNNRELSAVTVRTAECRELGERNRAFHSVSYAVRGDTETRAEPSSGTYAKR